MKQFSTAELEALIAAASAERAKREPAVAMEHPKTFEAILDPRWAITLAHPNTILQVRHPGLGWIAFVIPPNERAHLLSVLLHFALVGAATPAQAVVQVPTTGGGTVH
jgi:hypothetical protein